MTRRSEEQSREVTERNGSKRELLFYISMFPKEDICPISTALGLVLG